MELLGLIAEYNPFHNGHAYQLAEAKKKSHCDAVVVVMSGHFTQRGEPAVYDKWLRAEMALRGGADLVLELPIAYSARSAYYFALGGVLTLAACGIQTLAFGSESADLDALGAVGSLLADEPPCYQALLAEHLEQGLSYPRAQQLALNALLPEAGALFAQPNDLLAIHYLQILHRYQLPITPLAIKRQAALHSDQSAPSCGGLASGTAIRRLLLAGDDAWRAYVPFATAAIMDHAQHQGQRPLTLKDFAQPLFAILRREDARSLLRFPEVREGLENLLWQEAQKASDLTALCLAVKSKRDPDTRLPRLLCAILLNRTAEELQWASRPAYLRVLGFNATGRQVLKQLKREATLPVLTKTAAAKQLLDTAGQKLLALDARATDIYHLAYFGTDQAQGRQDYYKGPVILNGTNYPA